MIKSNTRVANHIRAYIFQGTVYTTDTACCNPSNVFLLYNEGLLGWYRGVS